MRRITPRHFAVFSLCAAAIGCSESPDSSVDARSSRRDGGRLDLFDAAILDAASASDAGSSDGQVWTIGDGSVFAQDGDVVAEDGASSDGGRSSSDDASGDSSAMMDGDVDGGMSPSCLELMEPSRVGTTGYPGGTWTVSEPTHGMVVESNVQIEMDDGVVLIGDVAYPTDLGTTRRAIGPFPVLLTQNPYGAAFAASTGELFVTHGYIYASIDVRGTSRSGGEGGLFTPRQALDGAALVDWAAALPGSDGQVGLHGCSQLGINQLETATELGPNTPVKAMIPACGSGDFYRDTASDNGIPTAVGSLMLESGLAGDDGSYYGDYWRGRDRVLRAGAIAETQIPVLFWSGWHEPGALGSLELYTALQNHNAGRAPSSPIRAGDSVSGRVQVILGDWAHAEGLDKGIELQWYDTWIKGIDTGLPTDTSTPLHLFEMGDRERWINARCYPVTETYTAMYLSGSGALSTSPGPIASTDTLQWVPQNQPSPTLEYVSEPFAEGAMLAGPLAARIELESSNTNAQIVVDLFDRAPDGTLAPLSHGSVLGSRRRLDETLSWFDESGLPARPRLTLDRDEPMPPGERVTLELPLWPVVWAFPAGHRLVVRLSSHPPQSECGELLAMPVGCNPTPEMNESLMGGQYTIHVGGDSESFVSLPLLEYGSLPTSRSAVSPTGAVTDPLAILLGAAEFPLPIDW